MKNVEGNDHGQFQNNI